MTNTTRTRRVWAAITANPRISSRELAAAVGLRSTSTAHHHVAKLVQAGYVEREGRARGFAVLVPLYVQEVPQ